MSNLSDLEALIQKARIILSEMTPEQKKKMYEDQKRSYILGEAAFGSDKDEAAYRAAIETGDPELIAAEEAKAVERVRAAEAILDQK